MSTQQTHLWRSLEEYYQSEAFLSAQGKEFTNPPMLAELTEMDRRAFLKVMGASVLMASAACSRRPVEKIMPFVNRPLEITMGMPTWYASSANGVGITVKTREGRPIKLEGNPLDPISQGSLDARSHAEILNLYDPDRLQAPSNGKTWEQNDQEIIAALNKAKASGAVRLLAGNLGPSAQSVAQSFVSSFNGKLVNFDLLSNEAVLSANQQSYGTRSIPRYRFQEAKFIVSFGADFLGAQGTVEDTRNFAEARNAAKGKHAYLACVEAYPSSTGANADQYIPVKAGNEAFAAFAVAYEVAQLAGNGAMSSKFSGSTAAHVEDACGLEAGCLKKLAKDLWANRGKSLVVGGALNTANAVQLELAVNLLNNLLGNDGLTVDGRFTSLSSSSFADLNNLVSEMNAGKVEVLIIAGQNPVFALPQSLGFAAALKKVKTVITLDEKLHETAQASTVALPTPHFLEAWGDSNPQTELYQVVQPVIAPLYNSRGLADSLLIWSGKNISFHDVLKNFWQNNLYPKSGSSKSFELFWEEILQHGSLDLAASARKQAGRVHAVRSLNATSLGALPALKKSDELTLSLFINANIYGGHFANNAWMQELPDAVSKIAWDNVLAVAPSFAEAQGWAEGDVVELTTAEGKVELPVHLQPKMHPQSVAVALGYGSKTGKIAEETGVNVNGLQSLSAAGLVWSGFAAKLSKTGKNILLACTQMHHDLAGRDDDIFVTQTWDEFQKNPKSGIKEHENLPTMWEERKYLGHKWGMVIDTNACTGCNACMIACQAENNVPVVGKDQMIRSREMHWIRVDRYYQGSKDNPHVAFQPMFCQQCDHAPCETVCPTLATYHSDDGLNMMTYNRCVGTRYCANNCPYKVRRFNFYDFSLNFTEPTNLALNPDVTVRTRGVMEKCTFCIQRIQLAKEEEKANGKKIVDGSIVTACQQSCPARAITFGDLNDPESAVAQLARSERGYAVLADLNTKPAVTYLTKIRNIDE